MQLLKTNCLHFPGYEWKHFIFRQKKYLKSRHFFKPDQGILTKKVHACSSRFSALKAERVWCAKLQTKLMNVNFRPRCYLFTFETGRIGMCSHCTKKWHKTHIRYACDAPLKFHICEAQFRNVTEMAPRRHNRSCA